MPERDVLDYENLCPECGAEDELFVTHPDANTRVFAVRCGLCGSQVERFTR